MKRFFINIWICSLALTACKKQNEWLDAKRQISDNVPQTLKDFQAIIDNSAIMNATYPTIGQLGADNYYFTDGIITNLNTIDRNSYLWNKEIFENETSPEYTTAYNIIAHSNIILEGVADLNVTVEKIADYNNVKGQALFFRSMMFYELTAIFCKPYDRNSSTTDLGICIRTKSDIHHIEPRSSVAHAYNQIINDLKLASSLLPVIPLYKTRPCKPSAFMLLSRTYLQMGDYVNAKSYADSALTYANNILDYNSDIVSILKTYRFPDFKLENPEIIFYATGFPYAAISPNAAVNRSYVDTSLYQSYDDNDLRKTFLFAVDNTGKAKFRGSYTGIDMIFCGIATNEAYLIRAECNARLNNVDVAIEDINKLLLRRYKKGTYSSFNTTIPEVALAKILDERRKELPFTGQTRWHDLRRLNKEISFSKALKRSFNGVPFELLPNDKRYVYPFPKNEIDLTGIQQNER